MKYSEEDLISDLKNAQNGNDMNRIRRNCREAGVDWSALSSETKKLYADTQTRIAPCPKEYKENPQVHYDIPHFAKESISHKE